MGRLKRKISDTIIYTHQEVYKLVRDRKIHLAEELFALAEEMSEGGDPGLLNYCKGELGPKRNLQKSIDAIWLPQVQEDRDQQHRKALGKEKLSELQRRARNPKKRKVEELQIVHKSGHGLRGILNAGLPRALSDQALLFDRFGRQAEIVFRPLCGLWRLRDLFELLVFLQELGLDASPATCVDGGLRLPRTARATQALEAAEAASSPELRLCSGCGALPFTQEKWLETMPEDPRFEEDTLFNRPWEEKLVRLWAADHVEEQHLLRVLKALELCHHSIQQTKGFEIKGDKMCVTGTKKQRSVHKAGASRSVTYGLACAHAALEEEKDTVRRALAGHGQRAMLLGVSSASDAKPEMMRSFYRAKALGN
ncbi:unnamed protein product [Effrenium voratum]|uniref:Uncharacterized protein n=1 Tax=Effrenium voratum TaxID=2562239 RepID=A0AA36I044_9DINO|nr:unnamed protein product [Effrenium voratum]CAJ1378597.1 unnamed protein product [Effrenium voratum]